MSDTGGRGSADVFISYKREERADIERIAERLRGMGLTLWFDTKLASGASFDEEINREVRGAKCVLVCWSPDAIQSEWVRAEASIGRERNVLAAVMLRPTQLYPPFNLVHAEDLSTWRGEDLHPGWLNIQARIGELAGRPDIVDRARRYVAAGATLGPAPSAERSSSKEPPTKSGGGGIAGVLIAGVAALGLAGGGFWWWQSQPIGRLADPKAMESSASPGPSGAAKTETVDRTDPKAQSALRELVENSTPEQRKAVVDSIVNKSGALDAVRDGVRQSGVVMMAPQAYLDLDPTPLAASADAAAGNDLWFLTTGDAGPALRPASRAVGTKLFATGRQPTLQECQRATYTDDAIDVTAPGGKYLCVKTSEGRLATARVQTALAPGAPIRVSVTVWR